MKGFRICRIFGIDIEVDTSWFVILGVIIYLLSTNIIPSMAPGQPALHYWFYGTVSAFLFFASLLVHELSHALVARSFGIRTQKIVLFILGGVAMLEENSKNAKTEFFMAGAGPASSLLLAGLFQFLSLSGTDLLPLAFTAGLYYLALANVMLAIFNLLPGFPLDGGRVFRAILWGCLNDELKATKIAAIGGKVVGILLILLGLLFFLFVGDFINGVIFVFIGWFLYRSAGDGYRQIVIEKILSQAKVKEIMECGIFPPKFTGPDAVCQPDDQLLGAYRRMLRTQKDEFCVKEGSQIIGKITMGAIMKYGERKINSSRI